LHLLGYDHASPLDQRQMNALQARILATDSRRAFPPAGPG
jgi:ssRNA-specific RNase YbeY (16S rRNA maturation enzyme)